MLTVRIKNAAHDVELGEASAAVLRREQGERYSAQVRELAVLVMNGPPILNADRQLLELLADGFVEAAKTLDALWWFAPELRP